MHPDHKVGLAVGLALLGLVGAMFYRRESHPEDYSPPELENVAEIDDEIAASPHAPYLNVLDDVSDDAEGKSTGPRPHTAKKPTSSTAAALDQAEEEATSSVTLLPDPEEADPIRNSPRKDLKGSDPAPAHNRDWQPTRSRTAAGGAESTKPDGPGFTGQAADTPTEGSSRRTAKRTHTIQAGDTLSRIAEKYLGSPRLYREIYKANQHQLRSVDDLPEGVTLVIPEGPSAPGRPTSESRGTAADSSRTRLVDEDEDDPLRRDGARRDEGSKPFKLQFEPVRRRTTGTSAGSRDAEPRGRADRDESSSQPVIRGLELDTSDDDDADEGEAPLIDRR